MTQRNTSKDQAAEVRDFGEEGADSLAKIQVVKTRHVITGILACVRITSQKQDAVVAKSAVFDMLRQNRSQTRSQRRVVRKEQFLC